MALTQANLGSVYLKTDRVKEAQSLLAQAHLAFARLGSPYADTSLQELTQACGSVEAAHAYLDHLAADEEPLSSPPN